MTELKPLYELLNDKDKKEVKITLKNARKLALKILKDAEKERKKCRGY